jgi:signal transduction histidine kinase
LDAAPHAASPSLELFTERIHPEDRALLHAALHQAGSNHEEVEYRLMTGNGHIRWVHVLIRSAPEREGVLQGTIMDITERRGAEEELRSYAEQLRSVSRRLLAGELHDRVGQSLTALGLNLSIIDRLLSAAAAPALRARLADSSSLVEQTMDSMRNVMGELRPQGLDDYGVVAPLRALAAAFSQRTGIRVEFEGSGPAARVGSSVSLAMFRIAQEALNNIAKHSKATVVQISFAGNDDRAILSISDNGVGFDAAHRKRRGWGLAIMQERAEAVGARFRLDSNEGGGTRITVDYAIPSTADAAQAETHAD